MFASNKKVSAFTCKILHFVSLACQHSDVVNGKRPHIYSAFVSALMKTAVNMFFATQVLSLFVRGAVPVTELPAAGFIRNPHHAPYFDLSGATADTVINTGYCTAVEYCQRLCPP